MEKLTKKQTLEKELQKWLWLAANPFKCENDYFAENEIIAPQNYSYLCEYDKKFLDNCNHCPISSWRSKTATDETTCADAKYSQELHW